MELEYQSNESQLPSEIVHDIQYAGSHEVSESDVRALLKTYSKQTKEELARPLNNWKKENQQEW